MPHEMTEYGANALRDRTLVLIAHFSCCCSSSIFYNRIAYVSAMPAIDP